MKRLASLALSLSLFPSSASAFPARTVYAEQAQGIKGSTITLKVTPGYGLNINFIHTGEKITKVWIDDPSRIALSSDGNLCAWSSEQQGCTDEGAGAMVIHLRQIKPIKFPNLPRSASGATMLTAITQGATGRKLYQFKIVPVSGEPEYTAIIVKPDSEKPTPVLRRTFTSNSQRQSGTRAPNRQPDSNTDSNTTQTR